MKPMPKVWEPMPKVCFYCSDNGVDHTLTCERTPYDDMTTYRVVCITCEQSAPFSDIQQRSIMQWNNQQDALTAVLEKKRHVN